MKSLRNWTLSMLVAFGLLAGIQTFTMGQSQQNSLESGFKTPPESARPRVWWHWLNGNITKEGIKLDLEWMKRTGIGGFQNFDASLGTPKLVQNRLVYMTPEWKDAFNYATTLANQLGLEEAIAGSPGWSESGGPWVKPQQGMKKFVWSETTVEGGQPFNGKLAHPPTVTGPIQNFPLRDFLSMLMGGPEKKAPEYYGDGPVVAFRVPASDVPLSQLHPKITSSAGSIDAAMLDDGDLAKTTGLPIAPPGEKAWVQFEFDQPQAIRAVTMVLGGLRNPFGRRDANAVPPQFQASDDGQNFHKVVDMPETGAQENTLAFAPVTARYFRMVFTTPTHVNNPFAAFTRMLGGRGIPPPPKDYQIAELALHTGARVNRFEEKAGFGLLPDLYQFATPPVDSADAIAKSDVVDLTGKMQPDGTLNWTPPPGRWIVLRTGYSLLGITNHPASPEGTGLEVDKLNPTDVKDYMTTYLNNYKSAVGPLMGKRGLSYVVNDSWEAGAQNWTDNMIAEFTRRRGYDPKPWLPVLTGRVVESAEASDGFLWDFRETLGEMLAEYHYDQLTAMLHQRGMGHYGESHEEGRAFIGDGMAVKRSNDVPMGAMWTQLPGVNKEQYGYDADIRESASVAHIYGQNLVAAESMTAAQGPWSWCPATLKPTADKELTMGLNRFVIHTSVHQPLIHRIPGLSLGPFGQWFTRNETWAGEAGPWITYLARNSYLLQQGRFAADIIYFYGEDSNLTAIFLNKAPDIPAGYNFDYVNADALIHKLEVKDGRIVTPSGMSYRVLALDPYSEHMSLPVLRKINSLVEAGAVVAGPKPINTPSLADNKAEFHTLVEQLWGSGHEVRHQGKGVVYGGESLAEVMSALQVAPDFEYTKPEPDTNLLFVHRRLPNADLYYVDNRTNRYETLDATFRVRGRQAELWHSDTGVIEPASYSIANNRTTVPLQLEPWGTVFVVFRGAAKTSSRTVPASVESPVATVEGPWTVNFQPERGAPPKITLDQLTSWSKNSDDGVKYFSGTGTYVKTLQAPHAWFKPGAHLWIDLGDVENLAAVTVNGKPLGIVWKTPFRVDATGALKPGANTLEIKVTDLWVNRMIGDRQPNTTHKYTFTTPTFYTADSPLMPSGLLGPVRIIQSTKASKAM